MNPDKKFEFAQRYNRSIMTLMNMMVAAIKSPEAERSRAQAKLVIRESPFSLLDLSDGVWDSRDRIKEIFNNGDYRLDLVEVFDSNAEYTGTEAQYDVPLLNQIKSAILTSDSEVQAEIFDKVFDLLQIIAEYQIYMKTGQITAS